LRIRLQQSLPDPTHSPFDSAPPRNATTSPSPAHMTLYHPPPLRSSSTNLSFANQLHLGSSPTPFLDHLHRPPHHRPAHTHPAYFPTRSLHPSSTLPSQPHRPFAPRSHCTRHRSPNHIRHRFTSRRHSSSTWTRRSYTPRPARLVTPHRQEEDCLV
jgi:hypothetical protein